VGRKRWAKPTECFAVTNVWCLALAAGIEPKSVSSAAAERELTRPFTRLVAFAN
jgi:hypothetical protein